MGGRSAASPAKTGFMQTLHVIIRWGCGLLGVILGSLPLPAVEQAITLPPVASHAVLAPTALPTPTGQWAVQTGGIADGAMNLGSLWAYNEKGHAYRPFTDAAARAVMARSAWLRAEHGRWFLTAGSGQRIRYTGNQDAGQLWISLHAVGAPERDYAPVLTGTDFTTSWVGVGRRVPVRAGAARGELWVAARMIEADELRTLSGAGTMAQSDFTGMIRQISSIGATGSVRGRGWALDAGARVRVGRRWEGIAAAEGLRGKVTWRQAYVVDDLVVSPRVYQDPDGFLHDFGGITGAGWREDLTLKLEPSYQFDLLYHGPLTVNLGLGIADSEHAPRVGVLLPTRLGTVLLRLYPDDPSLEIGAAGRGWLITLRADDMPSSAPSVGALELQIGPFAF